MRVVATALTLSMVPLIGYAAGAPQCAPTFSENFASGFGAFQTGRDFAPCPGGMSGDMTSFVVSQACGPGTSSAANVYQTGANGLTLQVKPTPASMAGQVGGAPFLGSEVTTKGTFSQQYGYFEMTALMPQGAGLNPAFWLLPANGAWPPELDVVEMPTGNNGGRSVAYQSLHTTTQSAQKQGSAPISNPTAPHTYGVDWTASTITWYVDGVATFQTATPADMHQPMYMLLDLFSGTPGSWQGAPTPGQTSNFTIQSVKAFASNPYTGGACSLSIPQAPPDNFGPTIAVSAGGTPPPFVETDPIDTGATATVPGGMVVGAAEGTAIPLPMGADPSTTAAFMDLQATSPLVGDPGSVNSVVPTYGAHGSGKSGEAASMTLVAASTNPSGDPTFSTTPGAPQDVVPKYGADYVQGYVLPDTVMPGQPDNGWTIPSNYTPIDPTDPASTPQLQMLMTQSYGQTAIETADQLGVNPSSIAAIAQVESNFQNKGADCGCTSATGPWQFTQGTFDSVSQSNKLGFSPSDINNPNSEATAAGYYLQQVASTVGAATGQPATTLQAYAGWVFGPDAGGSIANASSDTPLSSLVSAQSLANNGMSTWTVGQFNAAMAAKLGPAANQTVLTAQRT